MLAGVWCHGRASCLQNDDNAGSELLPWLRFTNHEVHFCEVVERADVVVLPLYGDFL